MSEPSIVMPGAAARAASVRRVAIVLGALLLMLGVLDFARTGRGDVASNSWSLDYDINLVAAQRLVDHQDIYSRADSVETGRSLIGPQMRLAYEDDFKSYIGTPAVALTHVPFLALSHDDGVRLFRILGLIEMIAAIVLAAYALAPSARLPAALFGTAALFWSLPTVKSLAMGQANGLVMLALALAIWATARKRWGLVGVGLGVATVLKLSPVLLLVYLFVRGRRRPMWTAAATAGGLLALAAVVGQPGQIFDWVFDIAPKVSQGTISAFNQSIVGAVARLTTSHLELGSRVGPGAWYLLAYVVWAVALIALWRSRRGRTLDPLELGVLVLVVLLAGPLTWDHYVTWALLPVVLVCDVTRWCRMRVIDGVVVGTALVVSTRLLYDIIPIPTPAAVEADWSIRLSTMHYTGGVLLLLGAAWWVLVRTPDDRPAEWAYGRDAAVGAARPVVAGGVH